MTASSPTYSSSTMEESSSSEGEAMGAFLGSLIACRLDIVSDNARIPHASRCVDREVLPPTTSSIRSSSRWDAVDTSSPQSATALPVIKKSTQLDDSTSTTRIVSSPTTVVAALSSLDHALHMPQRRPSIKNSSSDGGLQAQAQPPKWRSMPLPSRDSFGKYHYHKRKKYNGTATETTISTTSTTTATRTRTNNQRRKERVKLYLDEAIDMLSNSQKSSSSTIVDCRWKASSTTTTSATRLW